MSENDESNIEAPSPATPVKSPEKVPEAPVTPVKKEETSNNTNNVAPIPVPELVSSNSQPETPRSTPPLPQTQQSQVQSSTANAPVEQTVANTSAPIQNVENKTGVVKPGVLRFGPQEEYPIGNFTTTKPPTSSKFLFFYPLYYAPVQPVYKAVTT